MRTLIVLAMLLPFAGLAQQAKLPTNLKKIFESQLAASGHQGFRYGKHVQVTDAQGNMRSDEFREYTIKMSESGPVLVKENDNSGMPFFQEVNYAVEYFFQEAAIQDYYTYVQRGDTLFAYLKQDCTDKCDLRAQKIVMDPSGRRIRYIETNICRNAWLYSTNIQTKIHFSADGLYQQHTLCFHTDIVLIPSDNYTCVHGRARY